MSCFHLQKWKLQQARTGEEKRYDVLETCEKMIYVDIGYKSATH